MNFKLFLFAILIFPFGSSFAQEYQYHFKGFLGIQGGESFSYDLLLNAESDGLLKGISKMYEDPAKSVITEVTVQLNKSNGSFLLKESLILINNGFRSKAIICLINADLKYNDTTKAITGTLTSNTVMSGNCSKGSISFLNEQQNEALFRPLVADKKEEGVLVKEVAKKEVIVQERRIPLKSEKHDGKVVNKAINNTAPALVERITEGRNKSIIWEGENLVLEIWDDNEIDHDRISVYYNDKEVLSNYTLTGQAKVLTLPIGGNELNIIKIKALNEGGTPPNTAKLNLIDKNKSHTIIAYNNIGKESIIYIEKKL